MASECEHIQRLRAYLGNYKLTVGAFVEVPVEEQEEPARAEATVTVKCGKCGGEATFSGTMPELR